MSSVICFQLPRACAAAQDAGPVANYKAGMSAESQHNYELATKYFSRASFQDPSNALYHYSLANALAQSGNMVEALAEYRLSSTLATDSRLKNYCAQAIKAVESGHVSGAATAAANPAASTTATTATTAATVAAASSAAKATHQVKVDSKSSSPKLSDTELSKYSKSMDKINEQAQGRVVSEADTLTQANKQVQLGQEEATRIRQAADAEYNQKINLRDKKYNLPVYDPDDLAAIRDTQYRKADNVIHAYNAVSEQIKESGKMHTQALQDAVTHLREELQESAIGHNPTRLMPQGTNLYIRNYSNTGTNIEPLTATAKELSVQDPLHAKSRTLPPQGSPEEMRCNPNELSPGAPGSAALARDGKWNSNSPGFDKQVHGELIPPKDVTLKDQKQL